MIPMLQCRNSYKESALFSYDDCVMKKYASINGKTVIGLVEPVAVFANGKAIVISAKIDTGATKSSLDKTIAHELKLGPIIKTKIIKSAHGTMRRPIIELEIEMAGTRIKSEFTLADRNHMSYKMLIGQNILHQGFLIDPQQ